MESYTPLDDTLKAFHTHSHILKAQGNYLERSLGFFACKKVLTTFNANVLTKGLEKLPTATSHANRRILLVPNHRSCIDPVIVHYVLTLAGCPQPRVAALDFIASTPLAPLFKKCGAIFIKGDWKSPDYRSKMNEEFKSITDAGEWLEFYLEGARSTSGKQLDPRHGLFTALMSDRPCVIYPINISYERLIEDREFVVKKKGFQLKSTIQSLFIPGKGIGDVYFTVGDPIYTEPDHRPPHVALSVSQEIMKLNVIHGSDLIACILLDSQEHIPFYDLEQNMERLQQALRSRGLLVAPFNLMYVLKSLRHCILLKKGIVRIRDKTLLIYYRNRMMYAISDLATVPSLLRKEALWTPDLPPHPQDLIQLRQLAKRAIEPTIFLYKYLLDKIQEGTVSAKELRQSIEDSPHTCFETVTNFLTVLKEDGILNLSCEDKDLIILT